MNDQEYAYLEKLALDLRWAWNHGADHLWSELDPSLWGLTRNPWLLLQSVSRQRLSQKLKDPAFCQILHKLQEVSREEMVKDKWFQKSYPQTFLNTVAYFSMEFMLSEALPIYSGGLGNVAGDQLKAASDLGVPIVGIGLLYQQGYFRQAIDDNGNQQALYPYNDPGQLPITPLRKANGERLRIEIAFPGYSLFLRTWQVQVGRVKLFLLDSNDAANFPAHRGITSELYGGDIELRLQQEVLLGIGGYRLLKALGIEPEVCHLNEGHAAFAILERAKNEMQKTGHSFEVALTATRAGNLFTTHTSVSAGFDRFPPNLMEKYLGRYASNHLKISLDQLLALGRSSPQNSQEPFSMAYLAVRGTGAVNGVSRLHGQVSRHIFTDLFPHWPETEVPIRYVTNGVHMPTWDSIAADNLWTELFGKSRWQETTEEMECEICKVSDASLWKMRNASRQALIDYMRQRLLQQCAINGASLEMIEKAKTTFDPDHLTLGFARRFAVYKRPNLLLHDPERLLRLLNHPRYPVQLVIAGKAHPADLPGQAMIKTWFDFIGRLEADQRVVFLVDYDMHLAEQLVQGTDIWINTPKRSWEACGTSGMKILVNGGLNISELDGWWAEAYTPEVGWAVGDGLEHGDDPKRDALEANELYELLEQQVVPEFYQRDGNGVPAQWLKKVRSSMGCLTPQFSANRAIRQYTEQYYLPAAAAYLERKGALSQKITVWKQALDLHWSSLHFGELHVATKDNQHLFVTEVYLSSLDPNAVRVELYAEGINGQPPIKQEMKRLQEVSENQFLYQAATDAARPASHYTPRVIPYFPGVEIPLETGQILWQR